MASPGLVGCRGSHGGRPDGSDHCRDALPLLHRRFDAAPDAARGHRRPPTASEPGLPLRTLSEDGADCCVLVGVRTVVPRSPAEGKTTSAASEPRELSARALRAAGGVRRPPGRHRCVAHDPLERRPAGVAAHRVVPCNAGRHLAGPTAHRGRAHPGDGRRVFRMPRSAGRVSASVTGPFRIHRA